MLSDSLLILLSSIAASGFSRQTVSWSVEVFQSMRKNCVPIRSNSVFSGIFRVMKIRDVMGKRLDTRVDRGRSAGTGVGGQEVAGLARTRACQDLNAVRPAPAQPRGGQGAGSQYLHCARNLAALAPGRPGLPARQIEQWRSAQARSGRCRSPRAMATPRTRRAIRLSTTGLSSI